MSVNFDMVSAFRSYLDRNDWHYSYDANHDRIECGLNIKCKLQNLKLLVTFSKFGFTNYAYCRMNAAQDVRDEIMRYLTRANYGLKNGNFELDVRDGEIRYKIYTNCDGMRDIPDEVLEDCMLLPARMFDRYGDGLAALLMGFSSADAEIEKAEADMH